ncbi:ATP-binding cassette domain-containing protein [Bacillus sp. FJAT-49705]|uniref:ATP-binding cassette domain-containing protein n=1 Tax=Cytobacillus citreus TaxID=2833586 RepID=A0ABS5NXG7_9BACI|nr:ATP-binding cassette domain-containing protein [Cytobacillus citreus]MBS4192523.1 ATP-binding cassette domain-containing protein [Cytobacillus citreus]
MSKPILSVNQVGKSFKDKRIIENISFDVHKGEIMAILGPNGAGKSTTIRNIMGIMYPDEGSVIFHNQAAGDIPRHTIGYLPEERGLYKKAKIIDLLLYFAELKDYPLKKARKRALEYLAKFGLEGKEKASIEELSKGMGQKVQFIASVIHEPELLILDEPFSGLDPVSQEVFKKEIKELAENGTSILLSSHQMNLVEELCDRLFMINKGKKVIHGVLDDVKKQYANFKCTIRGENDVKTLERISHVQRIEQEGEQFTIYLDAHIKPTSWLRQLPDSINIEELSLDRISLHEIFIDIATGKNALQEAGVQT